MANLLGVFGGPPKGFSLVKQEDPEKVKLGNLFMVKCGSGSGPGYYHAGVCCNEEEQEIIHFTPSATSSSSGFGQGVVSKVSVDVFCGKKKLAIYKKGDGIPPSFKDDVREAMKRTPEYNPATYNCIHFALELLKEESDSIKEFLARIEKICQKGKPDH